MITILYQYLFYNGTRIVIVVLFVLSEDYTHAVFCDAAGCFQY